MTRVNEGTPKAVGAALFVLLTAATTHAMPKPVPPDPDHVKVVGNGRVIRVTPVGLQDDFQAMATDTRNLQWALNNVARGGRIALGAGTFHVSETLAAEGLDAEVRGAGMNETVLVARGRAANGTYVFPLLNEAYRERLFAPGFPPILAVFNKPPSRKTPWQLTSTNLTLRNLSFTVEGEGPTLTYYGTEVRPVWAAVLVTGSKGNYDPTKDFKVEHYDVSIKNVGVYGQILSPTLGSNLMEGLVFIGGEQWLPVEPDTANGGWNEFDHLPVNGLVTVKNCVLEHTQLHSVAVETFLSPPASLEAFEAQSAFRFPSPPQDVYPQAFADIENNVFDDSGHGVATDPFLIAFGTLLLSPSNAPLTVEHNRFFDSNGHAVGVLAGQSLTETSRWPKEPSTVSFAHNEIEAVATGPFNASSLFIADLSELDGAPSYLQPSVRFNHIDAAPGFGSSLIEHLMGNGLVADHNVLSGSAPLGISVGAPNILVGTPLPCTNDLLTLNNFANFSGQPILLGPGSRSCTAKVHNASDVVDSGINNTIVVVGRGGG
ncbi:hypothetical protein [Sorangium sp. So ce124]|uniref:hypothetical protein n=1 Tax=Sorangium sp. So ce124 TaxID=3133280 RepID=UPI003F5F3B2B